MNLREILAADRVREASLPGDIDQRVILHDLSWQDFELLLAMRGDRAGVRVTYLEGELELMSPSQSHEGIKKTIARILEAYALERGLDIGGFGSWTLKNAPKERALEPDECYIVGSAPKARPDLAIEVIWTSGGLDKLEVYRGLDVQEVWVWRANQIQVYELRSEQYQRIERSTLFPDFDLDTVARCIREAESQTSAVVTALTALRERPA
ncbi:MAG: Uma2 family endonuclease [Vicinamibacteraceae bacterium]